MKFILSIIGMLLLFACKGDVQPKPDSFLRLEYGTPSYKVFNNENFSYTFEYSDMATVVEKGDNWIDVYYPALKATLVLSYKPVDDNLKFLLKDAEKLTFKHMIKADDIQSTPYENPEYKVYGKMFEVYGNAATQIQFHVTDSVANFMTGALYFYAKPNYDSIKPAVFHVRSDVIRLMETLEWKEQ